MSTDPPQPPATGLAPLLSTLSEAQRTLVLDLQSLSVRKLHDFLGRHGLPAPGPNAISQRFIEATLTLADHANRRRLDPVDVAAIVLDGTEYHGETVFWALGITVEGQKLPLGFIIGPSESAELVGELFDNLHGRGLDSRAAIWIIDGGKGGEKALDDLPGPVARQRCTVHRSRRVVQRHLEPEALREEAEQAAGRELSGKELRRAAERIVYARIKPTWEHDDLDAAMRHLRETAEWLRGKGMESAARSLETDAELSLTLQRLGIEDRELRRALRTTNAIESTHSVLEEYRAKPDNWSDRGKRMRERFFVAGLACAERAWSGVGRRPSLERLQLAVLSSRHPEVAISLQSGPGTLVLERLGPAAPERAPAPGRARAALADLLGWADRKDRRVRLGPEALAGLGEATAADLEAWCAEQGFAPKPDRDGNEILARPARSVLDRQRQRLRQREAARDAAAERRREAAVRAGEGTLTAAPELRDGVSELAQELAPAAMGWEDLEALATRVEETEIELATVAPEVAELSGEERLAIARDLALTEAEAAARGGARDPLDGSLRVALGAAAADSIAAESAHQGELIARRPAGRSLADRRRELGSPRSRLAGAVAKVEAAAVARAAAHELRRRELLAGTEPVPPGAPSPPPPTLAALERYRGLLGARRAAAFEASARACEERLADLDSTQLRRLRARLAVPWHALDSAKARRKAILERDCGTRLRELRKARREQVEWSFRAEEMQRGPVRDAARDRAEQLGLETAAAAAQLERSRTEIDALRETDGNVDRFLDQHPEAALDYAAEVQLGRRLELEERARAAEQQLEQAAEGPEIAAGE